MSNQDLHAALARLHSELQGMPALDEESTRLLAQVTADIERLRDRKGDETHASRLESLAVRFEAAHPDLAARLRGIADALGRAGV